MAEPDAARDPRSEMQEQRSAVGPSLASDASPLVTTHTGHAAEPAGGALAEPALRQNRRLCDVDGRMLSKGKAGGRAPVLCRCVRRRSTRKRRQARHHGLIAAVASETHCWRITLPRKTHTPVCMWMWTLLAAFCVGAGEGGCF